MRRLAIVPARGGSKRLPDKNIRNFCGKPMMAHILETARESALFDIIHVSTDAPEIAEVARTLGFSPDFSRPSDLADDYTPIMPVLKYVVETYRDRGEEFDQVWLLMACSPLIETQDLLEAARLAEGQGSQKAVMSVAQFPVPVEWAFEMHEDGLLSPVQPGKFAIRSQDIGKKYYDTGSYIVFPADQVLKSEGAGVDTEYFGHVISKDKAIDIDDEQDWEFAEMLFRGKLSVRHAGS